MHLKVHIEQNPITGFDQDPSKASDFLKMQMNIRLFYLDWKLYFCHAFKWPVSFEQLKKKRVLSLYWRDGIVLASQVSDPGSMPSPDN